MTFGAVGALFGSGLALIVDATWAYVLGFVVVSVCIQPLVVRLMKP